MIPEVTQQRVGAWLTQQEVDFVLDSQGNFWLAAPEGGISIGVDEEASLLRMWGYWRGCAQSRSAREKLQRVLIDCGWQIGGVKVIDEPDETGALRIRYEHCIPTQHGMTDKQLQAMFVFWSGFVQAIEQFEQLLPELVEESL